jgi:hypothetical protein
MGFLHLTIAAPGIDAGIDGFYDTFNRTENNSGAGQIRTDVAPRR